MGPTASGLYAEENDLLPLPGIEPIFQPITRSPHQLRYLYGKSMRKQRYKISRLIFNGCYIITPLSQSYDKNGIYSKYIWTRLELTAA
jgi:hypothetical protein